MHGMVFSRVRFKAGRLSAYQGQAVQLLYLGAVSGQESRQTRVFGAEVLEGACTGAWGEMQ